MPALHAFLLRAVQLGSIAFCIAPFAANCAPAPAPFTHREEGSLILENIPPRDPVLSEKLSRYLQSRHARFLDWTADGAALVATRFGNTDQLHRVAGPLGDREQLSWYADPVYFARAAKAPPADRFVFLRDHDGDENSQVYLYNGTDRSVRLLSDGKSLNGQPLWAHDGKRIVFHSNRRDSTSYDIYVMDTTSGAEPRLLVGAQQDTWYPLDWSPDDQKLLVWKYVSLEESYLYVADANTGVLTPVDPVVRKGGIGIGLAKFSPDGRGVYYTSNEAGEFYQLHYIDLYTHENRPITADIPWDIETFDNSADGRYLAYVANEDGRSRLTVVDTVKKLELSPAGLPEGIIPVIRFDQTGHRLAMTVDSPVAPADLYVYDLEHNAVVRWTHGEVGPVDPASFVAPELIRYPTWDRADKAQRQLSAYLYAPATNEPHPVLIYLHGGPEAQFRPSFDPFIQFLVHELGFAVVAPNVRGSSGYGKSFLRLDAGQLRADAVKDVGSLLVWIGLQPSLDRNRVAVLGGSYGGYLALASLAAYNDRLRGGIDIVGTTNFERDPRMRALLGRISPLSNAATIRRPLLVVQGLNDPRVPASESQQLIGVVRGNGGEVWSLTARDEGHGFHKKANQDAYLEAAAQFLARLARP